MRIIISIAKVTLRVLLMYLVALSSFSHVGTFTPICAQQFFSKEHLKKNALIFLLSKECIARNHMTLKTYFSFPTSFWYLAYF
jgi:hypothetical protein